MNKIVILNNKKCQLITTDTKLFREIYDFLAFRLEGAEYTPSFKYGGWNGITHLMTKKGMFSAGLLQTAVNKLTELGHQPEIEDKRLPVVMAPRLDITARLQEIGKTPREHQQRILGAMLRQETGRKGIVRACTGSGKSLVTAMATAELNKPTIIYVIGLDLLTQFHDLFSSIFDEEIGFIGNGVCNIKRINIASIWTIGRALGMDDKDIAIDDENNEAEVFDQSNQEKIIDMLKKTKVHLFDECHAITTTTVRSIYDIIDPEYIYGFSGTPYRDDNSDLLITGILGNQIVDISASELIEKGLLVQPIIKFVPIPKQALSKETYPGVYKTYVVENEDRHSIIIREIKLLLDKNYKVLVLFKQIKHGKILYDMLKELNIKCEMLHGNDSLDRRNEVKKMIANNEIDLILASTVFDIGVDIPVLNALVLCGGGKSSIKTLQRIGRVIRSHPSKKFVAVVDTFDNTKYLKKHSLRRYEIYLAEPGFKVYKPSEM